VAPIKGCRLGRNPSRQQQPLRLLDHVPDVDEEADGLCAVEVL
jgi:hypothetical protein